MLGLGSLIADAEAPAGMTWQGAAPCKNTMLEAANIGTYLVWRAASFPAKQQPWGLATISIPPANAHLRE